MNFQKKNVRNEFSKSEMRFHQNSNFVRTPILSECKSNWKKEEKNAIGSEWKVNAWQWK